MGDESDIVKWSLADGVGTLVLNRPARRNALSRGLMDAMAERLAAAKADPEVRVVVITGAGERAFCAGGDLAGGMTARAASAGGRPADGRTVRRDGAEPQASDGAERRPKGAPTSTREWNRGGGGFPAQIAEKGRYAELLRDLGALGKPVVAALNGDAMGGGVGLLLACDLAVAADDVRVGLPEIRVGLWPMMVTALLVRHVGRKVALELMMLGEKLPAARARELGLLNRVVPRDAFEAEVAKVAGALAAKSPATLKLGRDAFYQTEDLALDAALDSLRDRLVLNTLLEDAAEGVMAFIQKRDPDWKGR